METYYLDKTTEFKRKHKTLEKALNVNLILNGKLVTIIGAPLDEYEATLVLEAINFGYSADTALMLKNEDINLRIINIKDFSRKKNLKETKGRIIGTHGQTKNTIEEISGCKVIIKENEVGILGHANEIQYAIAAITKLIQGSKQSNVYKFLERINAEHKKER